MRFSGKNDPKATNGGHKMSVRYAKLEDIKFISEIVVDGWQSAFRGIVSDEFLNSLTYEKANNKNESRFDKGLWCVCEIENEIVGFSWFSTERFDADEEPSEYDSELVAIYVRPELKGNGNGKKLFNFVTTELKRKGKNKMILWVLEDFKFPHFFFS